MNETKGYENLQGIPVEVFHKWFKSYAEEVPGILDSRDAMDVYKKIESKVFKGWVIALKLEESGDTAGIEMLRDACKSGEDRMRELITQ